MEEKLIFSKLTGIKILEGPDMTFYSQSLMGLKGHTSDPVQSMLHTYNMVALTTLSKTLRVWKCKIF